MRTRLAADRLPRLIHPSYCPPRRICTDGSHQLHGSLGCYPIEGGGENRPISTTPDRAKNQWKNEDAVTRLPAKVYGQRYDVTRFGQTFCGNTKISRVFSSVRGR